LRSISQLACKRQRSPASVRDPAPIQTTKLPDLFRIRGELPHNLGTLPITRKNPMLASRLGDDVSGLGCGTKPETITQFPAKACALNHQKNTGALAYNALIKRRRMRSLG
jgi:hypothetical protein